MGYSNSIAMLLLACAIGSGFTGCSKSHTSSGRGAEWALYASRADPGASGPIQGELLLMPLPVKRSVRLAGTDLEHPRHKGAPAIDLLLDGKRVEVRAVPSVWKIGDGYRISFDWSPHSGTIPFQLTITDNIGTTVFEGEVAAEQREDRQFVFVGKWDISEQRYAK